MFIMQLFISLIELTILNIPGGIGRFIRRNYYKHRLGGMGSGVVIDCGVRIINPKSVFIGSNTWIDNYVLILAGPPNHDRGAFHRKKEVQGIAEGEVRIGANCHIAPFTILQGHGGILIGDDCGIAAGCKIYSMSHHYKSPGSTSDGKTYKFSPMVAKDEQSLISSPVVMEDSSALGLNSVLLPGSFLGKESWVGSGSVLSGIVPAQSICSSVQNLTTRPIKPIGVDTEPKSALV